MIQLNFLFKLNSFINGINLIASGLVPNITAKRYVLDIIVGFKYLFELYFFEKITQNKMNNNNNIFLLFDVVSTFK